MDDKEFFTFREYMSKKENDPLTASMEDYLEMIYRFYIQNGFIRIHDLASSLNVQPPSATKMVQKLAEAGLVNYEKYGIVTLNETGQTAGKRLLERHKIIEKFLELLGLDKDILEETEKIEHTIGNNTLLCICDFVNFFAKHPDLIKEYNKFRIEINQQKHDV